MHTFFKRVHFSAIERWMFGMVAAATLARLLLMYFNWPTTNSDEGNMGLLALHVAFRGDHPTFFYGLPYMAPLEGYIVAPLFRLFGPSLFTLRIGLLPLFAAFLICMFYLTRLLYSEKFALAIVLLLSLGSIDIILLQIRAVGEYPETELFAALIPLLAAWLALTSYPLLKGESHRNKHKRILIYGCLGVVIGLALWVDFLIFPFVVCAGLLLLLFCYPEFLSWAGLSLLLGVIIGAFPLIIYNLNAPLNQNSLYILLSIHQYGAAEIATQHLTWLHHIVGTVMIALPSATGANPDCPGTAFPPFGSPSLSALPCVLFHGVWGIGYLTLWIIATLSAAIVIWRLRHHFLTKKYTLNERQELIQQCSRLMLLGSVGLTLALYASSTKSATPPVITYRYLIAALIVAPAIVWPLWNGLFSQRIPSSRKRTTALLLKGGLLLLIFVTLISGTVRTFADIPPAQTAYQQEDALVHDLLKIGATRIYSEYWTCNRLTFHSQEQIICSVVDNQLNPGFDRYMPYRFIVRAAPHPTYIFPAGSKQAELLMRKLHAANRQYQEYTFEGFVVDQVL